MHRQGEVVEGFKGREILNFGKSRQKDRLIRRCVLEWSGTGVEHLERSLITKERLWDVIWMDDYLSLVQAYNLAIREFFEEEVGLCWKIHLGLSCSFVPGILNHKIHISSGSSHSVTQSCSGSTFLQFTNSSSDKYTNNCSDGMERRWLRRSNIIYYICIVLYSLTLLLEYWNIKTWLEFQLFSGGQKRGHLPVQSNSLELTNWADFWWSGMHWHGHPFLCFR